MDEEFEFEEPKPQESQRDKLDFLFPSRRYLGHCTPENLVFDANLQEFSQRVGYITALETGGKISPHEAFQQLDVLWQQLKTSKENLLGISDE
ncbi:hypothetical protein V2H45_08205 [Tumidithrix elongata RA019]|uniref:Isopropylmalate/homocitrate/citramalate synthase n=1 Tax=Tumidithrix elongata BACA0141 TaxID=2716417 RepID=A0AAW9PZV7_9CYAN|nr:hypothetical protein [Tumidithrix elongata RA019]